MVNEIGFGDKNLQPGDNELKSTIQETFPYWEEIKEYTLLKYPDAIALWHFSGPKFGWSYRIKDKKRIIVYLLPREGYFKTALVFGQKATELVMASDIEESIKTELGNAKPYAEGRGIRIDIKNNETLKDIKKLIEIKIAN